MIDSEAGGAVESEVESHTREGTGRWLEVSRA